MRIVALILGLLLASVASADINNGLPTFNWTQPTLWNDGQALTVAQITGYQLNCTGASTVSRRISVAAGVPPSVTPTTNRFPPGDYSCTLAVYARSTPTTAEVLGLSSNPVSFTVPQPRPAAPGTFSAE